jgi:hypothetical protein
MFTENIEQEKDSLKSEIYEPKSLIEVKDKLGSSLYFEDSNKKHNKKEIVQLEMRNKSYYEKKKNLRIV